MMLSTSDDDTPQTETDEALLGCLPAAAVGLHENVILEIEGFLNQTADTALALAVQSCRRRSFHALDMVHPAITCVDSTDPAHLTAQVDTAVRMMGEFWSELYRAQRAAHLRTFQLTSNVLQQRRASLQAQHQIHIRQLTDEHESLQLALERSIAATAAEAELASAARKRANEDSKALTAQLNLLLKQKAARCGSPCVSTAMQTEGDANARLPEESIEAQWEVLEGTRRRLAALSLDLEKDIAAVTLQTEEIHQRARRNGLVQILLHAANKPEVGLERLCTLLQLVD